MRYPTTLQYIESLTNPDGLFHSLSGIEIVMGTDGEPIYQSGNFGTVFKVRSPLGTKALKCFTRQQKGRLAAYKDISHEIGSHISSYIVDYRFIAQELYVFSDNGSGHYYPILLMDWVEGNTLTHEIRSAALRGDKARLAELSVMFDRMSLWLLEQPFAHGDLKPDNIMVRADGNLVLIDYDGIYLPAMNGEAARENGTPSFQHPRRDGYLFNKHIDDYSIALISVILEALAHDPTLWVRHNDGSGLSLSGQGIIAQTSACYDELLGTPVGKTGLPAMLRSESPVIEGLYEAICRKFDLTWGDTVIAVPGLNADNQELMLCKNDGLYGFIDQNEHTVIGYCFEKACEFSEGLAAVRIQGKWGYADTEGRIVIPAIYQYAGVFSQGLAAVSLASKYGYIDRTGRAVSTFKFDDAWSISHSLGLIKRGDKYGFAGMDGRMAITARFDFAQSFSEGKACVMTGGKYGFIGTSGRWIAKPQYDYATSVHDGKAYVELEEKGFYISFDQ